MRAFIFDLDGTLLNTMGSIGTACNAVLARHGYPVHPISAYGKMVGNGLPALVKRIVPHAVNENEFNELVAESRQSLAEHLLVNTHPYPGMRRALYELTCDHCSLGVLSNKYDEFTKKLIPHYFPDIPFRIIAGASSKYPYKPHPDAFKALEGAFSDIPAEETCYVGDSNVDMETAKNAGIAGIGAGWGFRGYEELKAAGAWKILASPLQLTRLTDVKFVPGQQ